MKKLLLAVICCTTIIQADQAVDNNTSVSKSALSGFAFGISTSILNSKSHETAYMPPGYATAGRKVSELTWEAKNVHMLGLDVAYEHKSFNFYISYKKNISNGDGVMDDLDWTDNANPDTLTHWSHHDNTDVTNVAILDLGIKKRFEFESITPWLGVGYRQENQTYKAYDGYGNYAGTPVTFSGLGVTFDQAYEGFYLSGGADYNYRDFTFDFSAKYSPVMNAEFTDRHHFRSFTTTTNFDETSMLSLNLGLAYNIDIHQTVSLSYEHTTYDYIRGDKTRTYDDGSVYFASNSSALDSINSLLSVAYRYKF